MQVHLLSLFCSIYSHASPTGEEMLMNRFLEVLFAESKLPVSFPWSVQTAGKKYGVALLHFAVGTFLVPFLVIASIFGLAYYPAICSEFLTIGGTIRVLSITAVSAMLTAGVAHYLWLWLAECSDKRARIVRNLRSYLLFGAVFATVFPYLLAMMDHPFPRVIDWVSRVISNSDGTANVTFMIGLSLVGFVMGFGMQVRYIARSLRKEGVSLKEAMALTFEPLKGSWWGATLLKTVLPVLLAYGIAQGLSEAVVYVMGPPQQSTVDLAKSATGGNFFLFALMAVVGAPLFEEIVFRGFLFQIIRCSLKREAAQLKPDAGIFSRFARRVHLLLGGKRAEFSAVILSALLFSLMHMQFHPTTLVLLFVLGCVQAEIYRRTGSLYSGIFLHALNNGIDVLKIALGQV